MRGVGLTSQPGLVHGTLSMCTRYSVDKFRIPLNSVLQGALKKTVIVETRDAANSVVSYFRENRIGVVSCEILRDISDRDAPTPPEAGLVWLPNAIQVKDPCLKKVFCKLLG